MRGRDKILRFSSKKVMDSSAYESEFPSNPESEAWLRTKALESHTSVSRQAKESTESLENLQNQHRNALHKAPPCLEEPGVSSLAAIIVEMKYI